MLKLKISCLVLKSVILILLLQNNIFSQVSFIKKYSLPELTIPFSVKQTDDNGYLAAGMINYDAWIIRLNEYGDSLWTKRIGWSGFENVKYIQHTNDGNFILVGEINSFGGGDFDVWLLKIDGQGDTIWSKTIGGYSGDTGYCVQPTKDEGYIIVGQTDTFSHYGSADIWLIKTDSKGDTLWTIIYGRSGSDRGWHVQQTTDNGYIITGKVEESDDENLFIAKIDSLGNTEWEKIYGEFGITENGKSVIQSSDGNYIVAGTRDNMWLLKFDTNGDTLWTRTYKGWTSELGQVIQETNDNGFIITGMSQPEGVDTAKVALIKTDHGGKLLWRKEFCGNGSGFEVLQTNDGGFFISGVTDANFNQFIGDAVFIKTDDNGILTRIYNNNDYFLIHDFQLHQNYPNPFNPLTTIKYSLTKYEFVTIKIYNLAGQEVETLINRHQAAGEHQVKWIAEGLPSGIYFYRLRAGEYAETRKLILQK